MKATPYILTLLLLLLRISITGQNKENSIKINGTIGLFFDTYSYF
jgi:hypothetical protein